MCNKWSSLGQSGPEEVGLALITIDNIQGVSIHKLVYFATQFEIFDFFDILPA